MRSLLLTHAAYEQRMEVYHFLRLEPLFWIALLLCGAAGVWLARKTIPPKIDPLARDPQKLNSNRIFSMIVAVVASGVVVLLTIGLFAQDVSYPDAQIGKVTGQPGTRQVAFAVLASFTLAGFLIKYFLDCDHYLAVAAGPILYFFVISKTCGPQILQYMSQNWAIAYFPNTLSAILPIQIISVSAIGAMAGQWLAVKYKSSKQVL
jgi:MFS family permease